MPNGEIDNYTLTCSPTIGLLPLVLEATVNNVTIPMFVPGTTYMCSLRASNDGGLGSPAMDTVTTLEEGRQHNTESNLHFTCNTLLCCKMLTSSSFHCSS